MPRGDVADLSSLFLDWERVTATREGNVVTVRFCGIDGSLEYERIDLDQMYQALEDLRALGPQVKPR